VNVTSNLTNINVSEGAGNQTNSTSNATISISENKTNNSIQTTNNTNTVNATTQTPKTNTPSTNLTSAPQMAANVSNMTSNASLPQPIIVYENNSTSKPNLTTSQSDSISNLT
jgi:hypothetical protein